MFYNIQLLLQNCKIKVLNYNILQIKNLFLKKLNLYLPKLMRNSLNFLRLKLCNWTAFPMYLLI